METRRLPDGTVTLLFTDVEGSTRLLQELGRDAYHEALTAHRRLLRDAFAAHGGVEVEMQGDCFHFAFPRAEAAVAAAVAAQRALRDHTWETQPVRVRMGLHTGEPMQADGLYAGIDVHHAARVMSAGHGGQILLSERTVGIVREGLAGGVRLVDLGEHRLKDLTASERLGQVVADGLPADFPPPKTLATRRSNLPPQPNRLIGREHEVAEIVARLKDREARVLTLTGPGGTGKTRLALEVCAELVEELADGVFFVPLAAVADARLVLPAVAQAVGLRDQPGLRPDENLRAFLVGKRLLLLLDNFEQVVDAAADVARLVADAPGLRVLVTSREPLRISREHVYPVETLSVPAGEPVDAAGALARDAVALFAERAAAVQPSFAVTDENAALVGAICARLDGLPLAIELAAARVGVLSPDSIARRLERLELLSGGARDAEERQRTLGATIGWSYDLLDEAERRVLAGVSVFAGGCRPEAAELVLDPAGELDVDMFETLCSLVSKSLLRRRDDADGEPRFWMLQTIRAYARERLAEMPDAASTHARHTNWCVDLAERAAEGLHTERQLDWMQRISEEYANMRAAFDWSLAQDLEAAERLVGGLAEYWDFRGEITEGQRWVTEALATGPSGASRARTAAVLAEAVLAFSAGDYPDCLERCLAVAADARAWGDERLLARALTEAAWTLIVGTDDLGQARPLSEEALSIATRHDDRWAMAEATHCLALTHRDDDSGLQLLDAADELYRDVGDSFRRTSIRQNVGWTLLNRGEFEQAIPHFEHANDLASRTGNVLAGANSSVDLALCCLRTGQPERAVALLGDAIGTFRHLRSKRLAAEALFVAAGLVYERDRHPTAWRLVGAATRLMAESQSPPSAIEEELVAFSREVASEAESAALAAGAALDFDAALEEALVVLTATVAEAQPATARSR